MTMLTRDQILARKVGRGTVTLSDGGQVKVRALTRDEVLDMQELPTSAERDNFCISTGMTEPAMSVDDVAAWAANDNAGDLVRVSEEIAALAGMNENAGKRATKRAARRR